jgi:putative flippase GtrA
VKSDLFDRLKSLWRKQRRELIAYLVAGGLTTLVSTLTHAAMNALLQGEKVVLSTTVSVIAAILFAYVINRRFVFRSQAKIFPEIISFIASRLAVSAVFEIGLVFLLHDVLRWEAYVLPNLQYARAAGMAAVIIANYIIGKFAVFRKRKHS